MRRVQIMPLAVLALTAGAFGIGTTEFIIMGLLLQVAGEMHVSVATAGLLISGYALGVCVGAPILTLATRGMPRKAVLLALMVIFTLGNAACALAPNYAMLMAARVLTSLAHGTFFGVGSVVATSLVAADRRASAIATMFMGLTVATLLGVPFGAWFGLMLGWRAAFWAVTAIGVAAVVVLSVFVPREVGARTPGAQTTPDASPSLREELAVLAHGPVQLALVMTVLGFAGLFTVFTYIQPILTRITGFSVAEVSPILLVFGAGLSIGNIAGGRLADRNLARALPATLAALAIVLVVFAPAMGSKIAAVALVGLLGAAAFATVAPLQLWVLQKAGPAGQTLASSLNIAAFNLGNALGAWAGGITLDHGPGLAALPWVAAGITTLGLLLALWSQRRANAPLAVAG
jgi:DHA1 family inner membrane transport protein